MDVHFVISSSGNGGPQISPQTILRILSLGIAGNNTDGDGTHYLPFVQHLLNCKSRLESFDKDITKHMKKSNDMLGEMSKELQYLEDDEKVEELLNTVVSDNEKLKSALKGLEPLIRNHLTNIKVLSDYMVPPTEDLFKKKSLDIITKSERVPISKKNTCTICLENTADVIIKRECHLKEKKASIPVTSTATSPLNALFNLQRGGIGIGGGGGLRTTTTTSAPSRTTPSPLINRNTTTTTTTTSSSSSSSSSSAPVARKNVVCEKAICACGPTMCKECLIKHYWVSSQNGLKSYSKCVCCRAEFCLKDIRNVEYYEEEKSEKDKTGIKINNPTTTTTTTTTTSPSSQKNKKRKEHPTEESNTYKYTRSSKNNDNNNDNNNKNNNSNDISQVQKRVTFDVEEKEDDDQEDDDDNNNNNTNNGGVTNKFKNLIKFWK